MRQLKWTTLALLDFEEAQDHIGREDPKAAARIASRIEAAAQLLQRNPLIGNRSRFDGARTWVVTTTPYVLIYRCRGDDLEILRVLHARRDLRVIF